MSLVVDGNLIVECTTCQREHQIPVEDMTWEAEGYERQMGGELEHYSDFDFNCNCGERITIKITVWEYPIGMLNHGPEYDVSGARITQKLTIDCSVDDYEPDEE